MSETVLAFLVGLGLSAACGFRVFVPLLVMSIAAHGGHLSLTSGFAWIGSTPAVVAFSVAAAFEIAGYYIPWVDHFLDALATPAAVVAGTVVMASCVADMSPFLRWTLAVVAGGGTAAVVQGMTVLGRGLSTGLTGGLGNPVVATAELGGSLAASALSLLMPIAVVFLVLGCAGVGVWVARKSTVAGKG
jgi:hypothetical protein